VKVEEEKGGKRGNMGRKGVIEISDRIRTLHGRSDGTLGKGRRGGVPVQKGKEKE